MNIIYWVALLLAVCFCGWTGFGPTPNRIAALGGLPFIILFVLIGLKLFPIPL